MPANATIGTLIDDLAEVAYWNHQRLVRRRQIWAIMAATTLALVFLAWKAGTHLFAAGGLGLTHYKVEWNVDRKTWTHGGSTTVHSGYSFSTFQDNRVKGELRFLPWLHRIEALDLSLSFGLRDAEMGFLDELPELRSLSLDRTTHLDWQQRYAVGLTDATLARVGALKNLQILDLGGQQITDAGLAYLTRLDQLQSLRLQNTGITDAGLEPLKALQGLKTLDLAGTKVSAQGVADFEAARPFVKVLADPPPVLPSKPR